MENTNDNSELNDYHKMKNKQGLLIEQNALKRRTQLEKRLNQAKEIEKKLKQFKK